MPARRLFERLAKEGREELSSLPLVSMFHSTSCPPVTVCLRIGLHCVDEFPLVDAVIENMTDADSFFAGGLVNRRPSVLTTSARPCRRRRERARIASRPALLR